MSGVYIPGMKIPKTCQDCFFDVCAICELANEKSELVEIGKRRSDCPLVPVPDHGRLVDADALLKKMEDDVPVYVGFTGRRQGPYAFRRDTEVYTSICGAPTVIPADKEAET